MILVPAVFALGAAVRIIIKRMGRKKELRLMREGVCTDATVVRVTHMSTRLGNSGSYVVDARFTWQGQSYHAMSGLLPYRPLCEAGQTVTVYFMPNHPSDNRILNGDAPPRQMEIRHSL